MNKIYSCERQISLSALIISRIGRTVATRTSAISAAFLLRFFVLALAIVLASAASNAQNATATWALTSTGTPTTSGNISAATMSFGSGVSNTSYNATNGATARSINTASQSAAQSGNDYFQFTVSPSTGYTFTVTSIATTNSVSAIASPNNARFQILYSYSSSFTSPVSVGSNVTPTTTAATTTTSSLNIAVTSAQTLYVRVYAWNLSASTTDFRTKGFAIQGNACPSNASIAYGSAAYCKYSNTTATPTITGAAGGSFSSTSGLVINSTTGVVDVTNSTAGTYTVNYTVTGAAGCSNLVATTSIKINDLPTAFTFTGPDGATAQFCSDGSPATFSLSGSQTGVTYTFTSINPGGNIPPGQSFDVAGVGGTMNFTKTPDGNWSYEVVATDNTTGCTNTMNGVVKAIDKATVSQTPSVLSVCSNSASQSISVTTTNGKSLTWQVSADNGSTWTTVSANSNYAIAGSISSSTLTISNYTTSMNGYIYRVAVGSNAPCGTVYSTGTTLSVYAAPSISTQPASKTVCYNSTMILSVTASNATGYQWYKNGTAISGATSSSYSKTFDPSTDAASYYVVINGNSPCGTVTSTTATITAGTTTTWQGPTTGSSASTATFWELESNWSCGVPTRVTDAIIPADILDGYPTIKSTVTGEVRNLTINSGAFGGYLTVQGKLQVYGTVSNSGTFTATDGTIELAGSSAQTIPASVFDQNTVKNLIISNDVTLAGLLNLTGYLGFGNVNNKTFATAGFLTLKSTAAATARVADITNNAVNSGNSITGSVTVEKYLPSHRRYRLLTSPVQGATINSTWQEGRTWNGTGTEPSSVGTLITGASQGNAANANNNGFDFWTATSGASVFKYSGSLNTSSNAGASWTGVTNTKLAGFDNHEAYLLFVRGDRTVTSASSATTLKGKGPLSEVSSISLPVYNQSHTLIGNPFASPLNFKSVYADNSTKIEAYYWIWQAGLGSGTGGYVLMQPDGAGGYEAIPSTTPGSSVDPIIGSGEGFFVMPKSGASLPATLMIQQKHKASTTSTLQTLRVMTTPPAKLRINVFGDVAGERTLLDGVQAQYSEDGSGATVGKAGNSSENLTIQKEGKSFIVTSTAFTQMADTLQLRLWNLPVKTYQFELNSKRFPAGTTAVLVDSYLKTETALNLGDATTVYSFQITSDAASKNALRFFIVFKKAQQTLPLVLSSYSAAAKGQEAVLVKWAVENESDIKGYEIEKSSNGTDFSVVVATKAKGSPLSAAYEVLDKTPSSVNYYRIKLIGTNGETKYSPVMKVVLQKGTENVSVFPNPITGGVINLQFVNKAEGTYQLNLFNAAGQQVWAQSIQHGGGSATTSLSFGTKLSTGIYTLNVKGKDGQTQTIRVQVAK